MLPAVFRLVGMRERAYASKSRRTYRKCPETTDDGIIYSERTIGGEDVHNFLFMHCSTLFDEIMTLDSWLAKPTKIIIFKIRRENSKRDL